MLKEKISAEIRAARGYINKSQKEIGKESKLGNSRYHRIESGDLSPTIQDIVKIATTTPLDLKSIFNAIESEVYRKREEKKAMEAIKATAAVAASRVKSNEQP